jgi:hypothetical protein
MRKLATLMALAALAFAGCSSNDSESEEPSASSVDSAAPTDELPSKSSPPEERYQELAPGKTVEYRDSEGAILNVTLVDMKLVKGYNDYAKVVLLDFKVENTTDIPQDPTSMQAHFESAAGQVFDFSGIFCPDNDLPSTEIKNGQFAAGCVSYGIPAEPGRLIFEEEALPGMGFFIRVDGSN